MLRKLLNALPSSYYEEYVKWRNVGWMLSSYSKYLLDLYLEFSRKSKDKYNERQAIQIFQSAKNGGITIASLIKIGKYLN